MTGDKNVIDALLSAASMEASLSMQYTLDSRDLRFQGLRKPAGKLACFAGSCREYLEEISDRIFFLGGDPAYASAAATPAATVTEIFQRALSAETALVSAYNDAAIVAMNAKDDNTRNKFEHWIKYHEDNQMDWLARQLTQIGSLGEAEYIKIQLSRS